MRALTGSEVLVADKLFATLDTTVRALQPETKPRVLVSDTVGFIKKLPHDLVASFRSTLDEALEASLLLFVVDASDPTYESQLEVSRSVLREIGADVVPSRLLLNKIDRVSEADRAALRAKHPDAILLSAKSPAGRGRAARDDHRVLRSRDGGGRARAALREAGAARRGLRERARALRGLRRHRPDHEGARPARRHRAPAEQLFPPREFDRRSARRQYGAGQTSAGVRSIPRHRLLARFGSPPARYEQEMGGAIHELRACGICLLEPREFIGKPTIAWSENGIPPGIRHESTMKQVQTTQIVDVETAGEIIQQFDRCKLVKAKCNMSAVAEVDFATVPDVILFQLADFFDPVDKGRWSAANRTNSRMKYPDVTRTISFEISGKRATGRWLSAL